MATERTILCGGVDAPSAAPRPLRLAIYGHEANIYPKYPELRKAFWNPIPNVLRDLLDVALYVTSADSAIRRADGGRLDGCEIGAGWRRSFHFHIPVREPDLWASQTVRDCLTQTLSFLSEDHYCFDFVQLTTDEPVQQSLDFGTQGNWIEPDEVVLFSGGLDTLAGAIQETIVDKRRTLLVHRRSNEKFTPMIDSLAYDICRQADGRGLHAPITLNKSKKLGREFTQRTRSFLFAALAAVFARMCGLNRIRFYENGVTSINLPPCGQAIGARASRTTHPQALHRFSQLFSCLFGSRFVVENPFFWQTKTDIVQRIIDAGCAPLIAHSRSCAGTILAQSKSHTHCGVCSQCIDRRFAVLATGAEGHDPIDQYAVELMLGTRRPGRDLLMLVAYLSHARRLESMGVDDFGASFGELNRALRYLGESPSVSLNRLYELHTRHARDVMRVLEEGTVQHSRRLVRNELPEGSLLQLVIGQSSPEHLEENSNDESCSENRFVRCGTHWEIQFQNGTKKVYPDLKGFQNLHRVIVSQGSSLHAIELIEGVGVATLSSTSWASQADAASAGVGFASITNWQETIDDAGKVDLLSYLSNLEDQRSAIQEGGTIEENDVLNSIEQKIKDRLEKDFGIGGKSRNLDTAETNATKAVGNNIRRALAQIKTYDRALYEHLQSPTLSLGKNLTYQPKPAIDWET